MRVRLEGLAGHGGRGVTGHHDHLHPVLIHQPRQRIGHVALHLRMGLGAVGHVRGVTEIDKAFFRQGQHQTIQHPQPAQPGVEDTDGR